MATSTIIAELAKKKFQVYVQGEYEHTTHFMGFMALLAKFSDFFQYGDAEQNEYLDSLLHEGEAYVDANIEVRILTGYDFKAYMK